MEGGWAFGFWAGASGATPAGIGPVAYTCEEESWKRSFKEKKVIYGKANRIAPGGRTPGVDSETANKMRRKDEDLEHVFHFSLPWKFHADVMRCLGARTVTALTLGDGQMALAAMLAEKPFVGVAFTDEHRNGVRTHLANTIFKSFFSEGTPFFDAQIAKELVEAGLARAKEAAAASPGADPKPKGKATPKKRTGDEDPAPPPPKKPKGTPSPKGAPPAKPKAGSVADKMKAALAALGGGNGAGDVDPDDAEADAEADGEEDDA